MFGIVVAALAGLLVPAAFGQFQYERIKSFGFTDQLGTVPNGMIEASDGALYGTTQSGGTNDAGTVFKLDKNGSGYRVLHHFAPTSLDGRNPWATLLEGSDGALYGTTLYGGTNNAGAVFKLNKDGTGHTLVHSFEFTADDGRYPYAGLVEGDDGGLYGTTSDGGANAVGVVFRLSKDGADYAVLHRFTGNNDGDGAAPYPSLIKCSNGALYGVTGFGGTNDAGTIFKLDQDGSNYTVLRRFTGTAPEESHPIASLVEGSEGALYGVTANLGNPGNYGSVFKINKDGTGFAVLHNFTVGGATEPHAALVEGNDGALYSTTLHDGTNFTGTVFKLNKDGSGYTDLHHFGEGDGDGRFPFAGLVKASNGELYGTTQNGGMSGSGTLFKLNSNGGAYALLRSFLDGPGGDGSWPFAGLLEGSDGKLYGTTSAGGTSSKGTVFVLNKRGNSYAILHSFAGGTDDGECPQADLLECDDGALYGTTTCGGSGPCSDPTVCRSGCGTIFKLNKDGSGYLVLHNFLGAAGDGRYPRAALILGSDRALYGTTQSGGSNDFGTVFKLNRDGSNYAILHAFGSVDGDGIGPIAPLLQTAEGALVGTCSEGGTNKGGTVFMLDEDGGGYALLRHFGKDGIDGYGPVTALVEGSGGLLYGTTQQGGTNGVGAVFRLGKDGNDYAVLHSFGGRGDGWEPLAAMIEGADGALYGSTHIGGTRAFGTVFKLDKDGSGYVVLHNFAETGGEGRFPSAPLLRGSNGALYGTTARGGDQGFGTLFVLNLQPMILKPFLSPGGLTLRVTSVAGSTNHVQWADRLGTSWKPLIDLVARTNGIAEFTDSAPIQGTRFYRVVRTSP